MRARGIAASGALICAIAALANQPARAADMADAILRGSDDYEASPTAEVQDFNVELGVRAWVSSGKFKKNLYDLPSISNDLVSRLTYSGLTGASGEAFGRIDTDGGFLKGYAALGSIWGGKLDDEDFPPGIDPYSSTRSSQNDGELRYVSVDYGYDLWNASGVSFAPFVGYHYISQSSNADGCVQIATNPDICDPALPPHERAITEKDRWQAARLGVSVDFTIFDRLKLQAEAAWLPRVWFSGTDTHWLRPDIGGAVPEDGHGNGVELEGIASYQVTPSFSIGAGARYWQMTAKGHTNFGDVPALAGLAGSQPTTFKMSRYGAFVQGSYRFGT